MIKKIFYILFYLFISINAHNPSHLKQLISTGNCPNCDLTNLFLQGLNFNYANLDGANLSGTSLSGAVLKYGSFRNAKLVNTVFNQAILSNAKFNKADLNGAQFLNSSLQQADFTDAILTRVNFFWARLERAIFLRAKFQNTIFRRADLFGVNFKGSNGSFSFDRCGYAGNCPYGEICSYHCTNFCCTTMQDGSIKTDPLNISCSFERRKTCPNS